MKVQFCNKIKTITNSQNIVLVSHTSFCHAGLRPSISACELNYSNELAYGLKNIRAEIQFGGTG